MRKYLPVLILALIFGGLYYLRQRGNEIVAPDRPAKDSPVEAGIAPPGVVPAGDPAQSGRIAGLVVSRGGARIAGARIVPESNPVRQVRPLDPPRIGTAAVSGEDGSFAVPLPRGDVVDLRVSAAGYATRLLPDRCEGEVVRIILSKGATLTVTVTDPDGSGVVGANVMVVRPRVAGSPYVEVRSATGDLGRLVLPDLSPGPAIVIAWTDDWGTPAPVRLTIADGKPGETSIRLPRGRRLVGTVRDAATGEPIEGARVAEHNTGFRSVATNGAGRFEMVGWSGMVGGRVFVSADGYADASEEAGAGEEVTVSLTPGREIRGRVLDAAGSPVEGAGIAADCRLDDATPQTRAGATDADGRFLLRGLHPGGKRWHLAVRAPGHAMLVREFAPGDDLDDLVLVAARSISGIVLDHEGRPLADAPVEVRTPSTYLWLGRQRITADGAGAFRFGQLAPGEYVVSLVQEGGPAVSVPVTVPARADVTGVVLNPAAAGEVTIRVVDQDDRPVPGMMVWTSGEGVRPVGTGLDGRATFRGLPAKEFVFNVRISRFTPKRYSHAQTAPTKPTGQEITVRVEELSPIHGVVIGEDDKPLPHLVVAGVEPGGRQHHNIALTDGEGRFTLWIREGDTVDLIVSGVRQTYDERKLDPLPIGALVPGVTAPAKGIDVRPKTVRTDLALAVRLVLPDGKPVSGAWITPRTRTNSPVGRRTDAAGWARFGGLRTGTYEIHVMTEGLALPPGAVNPEPIRVEAGGEEVVLRTLPGAVVEGVFFDADGNPVPEGRVGIAVGDWYMSHATTDAAGRFRLGALPGRKLTLTANSPGGWVKKEGVVADGGRVEVRLER